MKRHKFKKSYILLALAVASFSFSACGEATMPDVKGKSLAEAKHTLTKAKVKLGNIQVQNFNPAIEERLLIVCEQQPKDVPVQKAVTLTVAKRCNPAALK